MQLARAQKVADEVVSRLKPYCKKKADGNTFIEVVGSIRRKKPMVRDVDILLIPFDPWNLDHEIRGLQMASVSRPAAPARGEKLKRISYNGVQVDLYFAEEYTWATLLLIRTGSKENNIRLATLAKKRGWKLKASGDGLFNERGERIAGDTEESIYEALGLPWQLPEERG